MSDLQSNIGRDYSQVLDERTNLIDDTKKYNFIPSYSMEKNKQTNVRFSTDATKGIMEKSLLSVVFFSSANIKKVQNKIRYTIWKMSKEQFVISEQSEAELKVIMRSIFLQYSKNRKTDIKEQVAKLNDIVTDNIAEKLFSNTRQYIQYLKDVSQSYGGSPYIERPKNVNSKGSRVLETGTSLGFGDTSKLNYI